MRSVRKCSDCPRLNADSQTKSYSIIVVLLFDDTKTAVAAERRRQESEVQTWLTQLYTADKIVHEVGVSVGLSLPWNDWSG